MNSFQRIALAQVYRSAPLALRGRPGIFTPFLIFAALELLVLAFLYLAPRPPVNAVLGPPIRVFWGEMFLHYPNNFLLLPKLASIARVVLYVIAGSFLNGVAVLLIQDKFAPVPAGGIGVIARAVRRYCSLISLSFIVSALFLAFVRAQEWYLTAHFSAHERLLLLPAGVWMGPLSVVVNLIAGLVIQAAFIYAVPAMLIGNTDIFRGVFRSLALFREAPLTTLSLVIVPVLAYVPIMVLQYKTPFFVNSSPETVVFIAVAGSLVNALIVDLAVAFSATYYYLKVTGR